LHCLTLKDLLEHTFGGRDAGFDPLLGRGQSETIAVITTVTDQV